MAGEAAGRRANKIASMEEYLGHIKAAHEAGDEEGYLDAVEHMMGVVGSEVRVYGGVVPLGWQPPRHCWDCVRTDCPGFSVFTEPNPMSSSGSG